MGVDQDAAQALDAEALDEAHAAHVGGQVVDLDARLRTARTQLSFSLRSMHRLSTPGTRWYHSGSGFLSIGADAGEALVVEIAGQRAGDEAAGAGDDDQVIFLQIRGGGRDQVACIRILRDSISVS